MADRLFLLPVGGGKNPSGTLDITSEGVYDVTDYAEVDVDIFNDTGTKEITDNGTYNAGDEGYIGYSQVTVDVPASAVVSGTKNITTNGTEDVTDYAEVSVNVPASEVVSGTKSITANGIEDVTDYASVDVNVPASEVDSGTLDTRITRNGETEYDVTGYAGHTVTVNVPASEVDSGTKTTSISQNGSTDVNVVGYATNRITVSVPNGTETKTVTDNGTYTPTAPNIGFSEVTVNVPASAVVSGTKSITTNGVEDVTNYANVDVDVQPNLQDKTVSPSTSQVTVTCDNNYDGLDTVTVNAVTSSIDANITAGNIKSGVSILGVTGDYDPQPTLDTLNVTPSTTSQTITPTGGVDGYDEVNVDAVTSSIDANISAGNIKSGVTILGVTGNYAGATCNLDSVNVTPSTSSQNITPTGGLDGFSNVVVDAVTSSIDNNITSGNIKSGVSILGVTGDYDPQPDLYQPSAVTPTTSQQTVSIPQGYDGLDEVTVNAVTSSIDGNITAGNIKDGVTILGVTGSYDPQPSLDSLTITPTTNSQSITPPSGTDGYNDITVNAVTSSIDANITAGNIKDGVTILGVTGDYDPQPDLDTLNVTPSTVAQTLTPTGGADGFSEVNVSAVTSSIDSNITASNIKDGVTILGVTGSYDPKPTLDSITITPTTSSQSITPTGGVDGYDDITVNAVTSSIDNNITAANIKDGVTILGVTGEYAPSLESVTVSPSTSSQTILPTSGYDGYDEITVNPVTNAIDANITAGNIKDGVTILGVTGSYDPQPALDTLNVTPSTQAQTITPSGIDGYDEVNVSAVTSSIDNNITAGNIKSGVSILGVTGSYDPQPTLYQASAVTPTTSQQTVSIPQGYDGLDAVTVNGVTSSIDANITAGNIKDGVTILGVTGEYGGGSSCNLTGISITPETTSQTFLPSENYDGFSSVMVDAVTSAIDYNIREGNIKDGVTILGVTGTYTGSGGGQADVEPLCFTAMENGSSVSLSKTTGYSYAADYRFWKSTDKTNWTPWDRSTITLANPGDKVYIYGENATLGYRPTTSVAVQYCRFIINGGVSASGRIDSLLSRKGSNIIPWYCFYHLFYGQTSLRTAPEFPEAIYGEKCCYEMFDGCTNMTEAPVDIPATAVGYQSFYRMFRGSGITIAPELPCTVLAQSCYYQMFDSCVALEHGPEVLPATELKQDCYAYMFNGCYNLFSPAPILPATTLAQNCYNSMFKNCGLDYAPELPATTVGGVGGCYSSMFDGCSALSYISVGATTWPASNSTLSETTYWVRGVSEEGFFCKPTNTTIYSGNSGIPSGWTVGTNNYTGTDGTLTAHFWDEHNGFMNYEIDATTNDYEEISIVVLYLDTEEEVFSETWLPPYTYEDNTIHIEGDTGSEIDDGLYRVTVSAQLSNSTTLEVYSDIVMFWTIQEEEPEEEEEE